MIATTFRSWNGKTIEYHHRDGVSTPSTENKTMPYVRIWVHLIWSTKNREHLLTTELRPQILQHLTENAAKKDIRLDCVNGPSDHIHALVSLGADQSISKLAQLLKGESSFWVNHQQPTRPKFEWQDEYIAVSVSESMVDMVREYIGNQEEHHRKRSFAEEYEEFMQKYGFEILRKG